MTNYETDVGEWLIKEATRLMDELTAGCRERRDPMTFYNSEPFELREPYDDCKNLRRKLYNTVELAACLDSDLDYAAKGFDAWEKEHCNRCMGYIGSL